MVTMAAARKRRYTSRSDQALGEALAEQHERELADLGERHPDDRRDAGG
jgi:hypothetical protein